MNFQFSIFKQFRKLFLLLLFISFIFSLTVPVFALELDYPRLPGIGVLKEGQTLGFYAKYFLNLFFYVAAGVCLLTIITGGILYIAASQKPAVLVRARELINRGLFGLFILLTSFLVLFTINPQLLIFRLETKAPILLIAEAPEPEKAEVGFLSLSLDTTIDYILVELTKEATPTEALIGPSTVVLPSFEIPFYEAKVLSQKLASTTQQLKEFLDCCQCGMSEIHYGFDIKMHEGEFKAECQCLPGSQEGADCVADNRVVNDCYKEQLKIEPKPTPEQIAAACSTAANPTGKPKDCWGCENMCEQCECTPSCLNRVWRKWKFNMPGWEEKTQFWLTKPMEVVRQKRAEFAELVEKLRTLKTTAAKRQLDLTQMALELQKLSYLIRHEEGVMSGAEFESSVEDWGGKIGSLKELKEYFTARTQQKQQGEQKETVSLAQDGSPEEEGEEEDAEDASIFGINVVPLLPPGLELGDKLKPGFLTFYALISDPEGVISRRLAEANKKEFDTAQIKASLYLIMTGLSAEEFQEMIADCFRAAFGAIDIEKLLNTDDIEQVIEEIVLASIDQGIIDNLSWAAQRTAIDKNIKEDLQKGTKKKVSERALIKCVVEYSNGNSDRTDTPACKDRCQKLSDIEACVSCCGGTATAERIEQDYIPNCRNDIPADFLSRKITEFLTKDIEELLPDKIQEVINKTVEEVILSEGLREDYLDQNILALLQRASGDIAQWTLQNQFPEIMDTLSKTLISFIPDFTGGWAGKIDRFLFKQLAELKEKIDKKLADWIDYQVTQLALIFTEKVMPWSSRALFYQEYILRADDVLLVEDFLDAYYPRASWMEKRPITSKGRFIEHCTTTLGNGRIDLTAFGGRVIPPGEDWLPEDYKLLEKVCEGSMWEIMGSEVSKERTRELWEALTSLHTYTSMFAKWGADLAEVIVAGFKALPGQLILAISRTFAHTATAFIQAWVEDTVSIPLYPYLKQFKDFRDSVHDFLHLSIKDILPGIIKRTLERNLIQNLEAFLSDVCKAGQQKRREGEDTVLWRRGDYGWLTADATTSTETAEKACRLSSNLHEPLRDKLPQDIQEALAMNLKSLLSTSTKLLLDKTLTDVIFEEFGIPDIDKIIKVSPKELMCGELNLGTGALKDKCAAAVVIQPDGSPEFDFDKPEFVAQFGAVSLEEKARLEQFCQMTYPLCQLTVWERFPFFVQPLGAFIAERVRKECDFIKEKKCAGQLSDCAVCIGGAAVACCEDQDARYACESCNVALNQTIAYSLVYYSIRKTYDLNDCGIESHIYPDSSNPVQRAIIEADICLREKKDKEIIAYQRLYYSFPQAKFPALRADVDRVIQKRGLWWYWAQDKSVIRPPLPPITPRQEAEEIANLDRFPEDKEDVIAAFVSYFLRDNTLEDLLTDVPLGVVKPEKPGEATIFYAAGKGEGKNFLAKTPFGFLDVVCQKVKYEWQTYIDPAKFPAPLPPYDGLSPDEIDAYKHANQVCQNLDRTPGAIIGLADKLINYTDGYENMFRMLKGPPYFPVEVITEEEMPPQLNTLLNYIFNKTPVDAMRDGGAKLVSLGRGWMGSACAAKPTIAEKQACCGADTECLAGVETEAAGIWMQKVADFLDNGIRGRNTVRGMLIDKWPDLNKKPFIRYIFEIACSSICQSKPEGEEREACERECTGILDKTLAQILGVEEAKRYLEEIVKQIFTKTPVWLVERYLTKSLLEYLAPDDPELLNKLKTPVADHLASKYFILGRPVIDTIGGIGGGWLNKRVKDGLDFIEEDVYGEIDGAVEKLSTTFQEAFDYVLLETPQRMLSGIAHAFDLDILDRFTNNLFMLSGGCDKMADESGCVSEEGHPRVYFEGTKECCDLGEALTCVEKPAGDECLKCRYLGPHQDQTNCTPEEEYRTETSPDGAILGKCCRKTKEEDGKCCQTVLECIVEKITYFLVTRLTEVLEHGSPHPNVAPGMGR